MVEDESVAPATAVRRSVHFANLSNGVLCAPAGALTARIQSTWCEQKRWEDVLWTIPVDMYRAAGRGERVVIHDQSERVRLTRAQWQGLSMLRYVLRRTWGLPCEPEYVRGGHNATGYWAESYAHLSDRVIRFVAYFRTPFAQANIVPCDCDRIAARLAA